MQCISFKYLFLTCVIAIFASCSPNNENVGIGVIVPTTGPISEIHSVIEGLELAVDDVNVNGGIDGREITLEISQCRYELESCRQAFLMAENTSRPLLYITATDLLAVGLSPVAEEHSVVLVSLASSIRSEKYSNNLRFSYFSSVEQEVQSILQVLEQLQIKKLGIFFQNDQLGRIYEENFRQIFTGTGREIFSESFEYYSPESVEKSWIPGVSDAIYVTGFTDNVVTILQTLRDEKYSGIILADSGLASVDTTSSRYNDIYLAAPGIYNYNNVHANDTRKRYEQRYEKTFNHFVANGYDFIQIVVGLLENEELTRANVRDLLMSQFSYPGVFGYIEKQQGEHSLKIPLYPARVVAGEINYLK